MIVVFVGDRPSARNYSPGIPFVGSPSYKRLRKWCEAYGLKPYLLNSHNAYWLGVASRLQKRGMPIVALGTQASKRLANASIHHFKAPHPSGLNRQLNNAEFVDQKLQELVLWAQQVVQSN